MRLRILLVTLTLFGLGSGYLSWMLYECTPGQAARPPARYPESGPLPRLLLFLHPGCPCSRATLTELACLRPRFGRLNLEIVLTGSLEGAAPGLLSELHHAFGGDQLVSDPEGKRRELYQVWTSGQLIGYDAQGRLGFCGGITASRGQAGPSLGRASLLAWLDGQPLQQSVVFGCPLVHPDEMCCQRQGTGRRNQ